MEELPPPPDLEHFPVGKVVADRYEVLGQLGFGAMGFVLKAKDLVLDGEIVVLKILQSDLVKDASILARFRREVLLTRKLSHPNIVKIFDLGDAGNNTFFISMEFVEGESLGAKLEKARGSGLPFDSVVRYLYQVALGLSYAHSQGIIHRDIKPANMLVSPGNQLKITDLGVARSLESTEKLTMTDEAVGSPVYMSPEQLSVGSPDYRSDIYSLGIMAYELAVGNPPFFSENWLTLVKMHLGTPMPAFASKAKGIPFWFEELVFKATEKDPKKRFQSASDFAKFISAHFDISDSVPGIGPAEGAGSSSKFSELIIPIVLVVLIALFAIAGYFIFKWTMTVGK